MALGHAVAELAFLDFIVSILNALIQEIAAIISDARTDRSMLWVQVLTLCSQNCSFGHCKNNSRSMNIWTLHTHTDACQVYWLENDVEIIGRCIGEANTSNIQVMTWNRGNGAISMATNSPSVCQLPGLSTSPHIVLLFIRNASATHVKPVNRQQPLFRWCAWRLMDACKCRAVPLASQQIFYRYGSW